MDEQMEVLRLLGSHWSGFSTCCLHASSCSLPTDTQHTGCAAVPCGRCEVVPHTLHTHTPLTPGDHPGVCHAVPGTGQWLSMR